MPTTVYGSILAGPTGCSSDVMSLLAPLNCTDKNIQVSQVSVCYVCIHACTYTDTHIHTLTLCSGYELFVLFHVLSLPLPLPHPLPLPLPLLLPLVVGDVTGEGDGDSDGDAGSSSNSLSRQARLK